MGVTVFNYAYVLQNRERFSSVSQRGFDLDPTLVDILFNPPGTHKEHIADNTDCVAAACLCMYVGKKQVYPEPYSCNLTASERLLLLLTL